MLYSYIVYLYRSEKKGEKDYEKLGRIAIDDEIDSTPINTSSAEPSDKRSEKNE
jgi:cytochrome c oxidase cbb3-type subunit 4